MIAALILGLSSMSAFLHRHGQLIAFIVLALVMAFTVNKVVQQASVADDRATTNRQDIIEAGTLAVGVGCEFDYETNQSLRGVLTKVQNTTEALYEDGTISQKQVEAYRIVYKQSLEDIPVPDCDARVHRFVKTATGK